MDAHEAEEKLRRIAELEQNQSAVVRTPPRARGPSPETVAPVNTPTRTAIEALVDAETAASQRVRLGWWLASILASFGFYSSLEYLTAFVGLNSLLISVLLPIFFYLRLHRRLSGARAAALYALLALSVVLSVRAWLAG